MKIALTFGLFLVAVNLFASTFYVTPNGKDTNSGTSWGNAFATVNKAVAVSTNGDVVLVTNGTYLVTNQITIYGKAVTVKSVNGASSTILEGNNNTRIIFIGCCNGIVEGFTIRNGYSKGTTFDRYGYGPGGGGVRIEYKGSLRNCVIVSNRSDTIGGGVYLHHGVAGIDVVNCTIVNNYAVQQGGGLHCFDVYPNQVRNCIIYYNTAKTNANWGNNCHAISYCCLTPATTEGNKNNIVTEPKFVNGYHLSSDSLCINAGLNNSWASNAIDMDGCARIANGVVDIGASECNLTRANFSIVSQPASLTVSAGSVATFSITVSGVGLTYRWLFNGITIANVNTPIYSIANVAQNRAGNYQCVVANASGSITSAIASLTVLIPPTIAQNPASLRVPENTSASFRVVANGSPTLTYQWKKNGNAIIGANNAVLTINSVGFANDGFYSCEVRNSVGVTNSLSATLIVTRPPQPNPVRLFSDIVASDGIYCDKVRITWTAVPGAKQYQIWRSTEYQEWNPNQNTPPKGAKNIKVQKTLVYDDTDVVENTNYYYWVRAVGIGNGNGTLLSGCDNGWKKSRTDYCCADVEFNDVVVDVDFYYALGTFRLLGQNLYDVKWKGYNSVPLVGDYNGDGYLDFGTYDPNLYRWYVEKANGVAVANLAFGWNGTTALSFDYDEDGITDYALYDTETDKWYIYNRNGMQIAWGVQLED